MRGKGVSVKQIHLGHNQVPARPVSWWQCPAEQFYAIARQEFPHLNQGRFAKMSWLSFGASPDPPRTRPKSYAEEQANEDAA